MILRRTFFMCSFSYFLITAITLLSVAKYPLAVNLFSMHLIWSWGFAIIRGLNGANDETGGVSGLEEVGGALGALIYEKEGSYFFGYRYLIGIEIWIGYSLLSSLGTLVTWTTFSGLSTLEVGLRVSFFPADYADDFSIFFWGADEGCFSALFSCCPVGLWTTAGSGLCYLVTFSIGAGLAGTFPFSFSLLLSLSFSFYFYFYFLSAANSWTLSRRKSLCYFNLGSFKIWMLILVVSSMIYSLVVSVILLSTELSHLLNSNISLSFPFLSYLHTSL